MDLGTGEPVVPAVIPLQKIFIDLGNFAEPCQLACSRRPLQRAAEDSDKGQAGKPFTQTACIALATRGERQIGPPCVLTGKTPCSLAVPRQIDGGKCFQKNGKTECSVFISGFGAVLPNVGRCKPRSASHFLKWAIQGSNL